MNAEHIEHAVLMLSGPERDVSLCSANAIALMALGARAWVRPWTMNHRTYTTPTCLYCVAQASLPYTWLL